MSSLLSRVLINYGNFMFTHRNVIFPLVLLILLVGFEPGFLFNNSTYDNYLDMVGVFVIICGQLIRIMVIGLVYIKRGGVSKKIHAANLVTSGIFSHCRNPLYFGNILIISGFLIVHNNLWAYIIGGSFFLLSYSAIIHAEESFLSQKFNQAYLDYCKSTPRWWFNFSGIRATFKNLEFNWRRVILKDYTTMLTWTITLDVILARQSIVKHGLKNSSESLAIFFMALIILLVAGFLVRFFKKSGRLTEEKLSLTI